MNDISIVRPVVDLAQLATLINTEHTAALAALKSGTERARACGQLLLQAKKACGHGAWLPWLEKNCPSVGARQAQKYMRLAQNWDKLQLANTNSDSHLSIDAALAELSTANKDETSSTACLPAFVRDWLAEERRVCGLPRSEQGTVPLMILELVPSAEHRGYVFVRAIIGSEDTATRRPIILSCLEPFLVHFGLSAEFLSQLEWLPSDSGPAAENPWLDGVWSDEPTWRADSLDVA